VRVRGELDSADKALKSAGITVQEAFGGFDGKLNLVALGAVVEAKTEANAVAQVRDKLPDGDFDLEVDPPASDELAREPRFERRHPLPEDSV
jgi:hypothetical protein